MPDETGMEIATLVVPDPPEAAIGQLTQVTRAIVRIYKEQFGRGPTHAFSQYAGEDVIICVLEGTLTPVERSLVLMDELKELQNIRQLFQAATEATFRAAVQDITGRKVTSFMSGNDVKNDLASEIFVLEREPRRT